jgi:hypothetical protein
VLRISSGRGSVVFGSSLFLLGGVSADRKGRVNKGTERRAKEGKRKGGRRNEERKNNYKQ